MSVFSNIFDGPKVRANSDPPGAWKNYLSGNYETDSRNISEDSSLKLSAVFNAVTIISNSLKSWPMSLYRRNDGVREVVGQHPMHKMVHFAPSHELTPSRFKRLMMVWVLLWGNARAAIEPTRGGAILRPLHPSRVRTERDSQGRIIHRVLNNDGTMTSLPDADVLHFQGLSKDGLQGLSVIGQARQSLGLTVNAEQYGARFFKNNAMPSVVLEHPLELGAAAKEGLKQSWMDAYSGDGQHGVFVAEEDMKAKTFSIPNEDAQFLQTRTFQIVEVARWYNVPPHKLKELSNAHFKNIESQRIEYVDESVLPYAIDIEEEMDRKLLGPSERETMFFKFNLNASLRADSKTRSDFYDKMTRIGAMTVNDVLALEEQNGIGAAGDMHTIELNKTTLEKMLEDLDNDDDDEPGDNGKQPADEDSNETKMGEDNTESTMDTSAFVSWLSDVYSRMSGVASKSCKRAVDAGKNHDEWASKFYDKHECNLRDAIGPVMDALAKRVSRGATGQACDDWLAFSCERTARASSMRKAISLEESCNAAFVDVHDFLAAAKERFSDE